MPSATRPDPARSGYLRGVRVAEIDPRRVVQVIVVAVVAGLVAMTVSLAVSASAQDSSQRLLRHEGVSVPVRVTGCLGISSGIGMGIEYWECRGTYTLDGRTYNEVIGGSRPHLADGQVVDAIAVPGRPDLLAAPVVIAGAYSPWTPFVTPIILGALAVVISAGYLLWWARRGRRPRQAVPGSLPGDVPLGQGL